MRGWIGVGLLVIGCGAGGRAVEDREAIYGPLEVGADYTTYRKLTPEPFRSRAHGDRWVEVYVHPAAAADAYLAGREMPVGSVVVKTSWQDAGGKPSQIPGPIFVMKKEPPGTHPALEDWWYAIHWERPADGSAPIYWRGSSPKADYCWKKCHENYDRALGGLIPSSLVPR